jgi:hypothetical protein
MTVAAVAAAVGLGAWCMLCCGFAAVLAAVKFASAVFLMRHDQLP